MSEEEKNRMITVITRKAWMYESDELRELPSQTLWDIYARINQNDLIEVGEIE